MGEMPKGSLLRHAYYHLGPGPRTVVEHAVVPFLPNGPRPKGHDRVESTTMLPRNFESAGAVPLVEGNIAREEAMWEPEAREDGPPQLCATAWWRECEAPPTSRVPPTSAWTASPRPSLLPCAAAAAWPYPPRANGGRLLGYLDEQFNQLEELQDESSPNFVEEVAALFFKDSSRLLTNIEQAIDKYPQDFYRLDSLVQQLKGSGSSIGALRMKNECSVFKVNCNDRNLEGCRRSLQKMKREHATLKQKLESYFQLLRQVGPRDYAKS
uniref:Histidine-containing phosphotransfer protein n=1 Tax=Oryza rufipogon TaxID=4529 RepID=A0A0E0PIF4_ORYRU